MLIVAALYRFTRFADPEGVRGPLRDVCEAEGVKGSLLIASEGINGTIAGPGRGSMRFWRISGPCPVASTWSGRKAPPPRCPLAASRCG
jgi:hypothetical protein